tara:strand:- start:76958 stop:79078 length:2121 start_codon:yes stop_codon:yes gene_type:complete
MKKIKLYTIYLFVFVLESFHGFSQKPKLNIVSKPGVENKQSITAKVNVFLGTSGDHGQMSPSASSPFNMLSIGPQTKSHNHTGYEYYDKNFEGFTHTHLEGIGCTGSGGNILIKPILDKNIKTVLLKTKQKANPGYYEVSFENGIQAAMSVNHNFGVENYSFPKNTKEKGLFIDLSFALANRFISEEHTTDTTFISGFIDTYSTCHRGVYRIYYALEFDKKATIEKLSEHTYYVSLPTNADNAIVKIGLSSVNVDYAKKKLSDTSLEEVKALANAEWNSVLSTIIVNGESEREDLFYSLLYRGLQSPYKISENDGTYAAINGSIQNADFEVYNGWAIWDNYREQLPMLSLFYPNKYKDISKSIANLYRYGKKNWATKHEPSPTVRTEHAIVVLLDAYEKKYSVNFATIKDSIIREVNTLDFGSPDKALESSYDLFAAAKIMEVLDDKELSESYYTKALDYKNYWEKDFADMSKNDVDRMQARGLYQGTIWQYRWFVPYDIEGLKSLTGGEEQFIKELDQFFDEENYNHANQPDLQVPGLYNATKQPWKSQKIFRNLLLDTVVQNYFNDNSKGIDPYIGRIYQNKPKAYLRTMDDDAGTMSSWFVLRSMGISAVNIGTPVYYITAPIFKNVSINYPNGKSFEIEVKNYHKDHFYVQSAILNGKSLNKNWLHHDDIIQGGKLIIETSATPNKNWGVKNQFITKMKTKK